MESIFDDVEAVTESSKTLLLAVPSEVAELMVAISDVASAAKAERVASKSPDVVIATLTI